MANRKMKGVNISGHARDHRCPFGKKKLKEFLNSERTGWLVKDRASDRQIKYVSGFAIVFEERTDHFIVITSFPKDNPEKWLKDPRYEVVHK